jgi:hypothetical protein
VLSTLLVLPRRNASTPIDNTLSNNNIGSNKPGAERIVQPPPPAPPVATASTVAPKLITEGVVAASVVISNLALIIPGLLTAMVTSKPQAAPACSSKAVVGHA